MKSLAILLCSLLWWTAPPAPSRPSVINHQPSTPQSLRTQLLTTAASQIGTQEATGHNDGPVVKYLTSVGLSKGDPYCAAFVYWCGKTALGPRNPFPRSGYSPDFGQPPNTTARITPATSRPGDTFVIYHPAMGRIGHTGLVAGWQNGYLKTIEANTSPSSATLAQDRDATTKGGVWSKLRPPSTLYRTKSWLP